VDIVVGNLTSLHCRMVNQALEDTNRNTQTEVRYVHMESHVIERARQDLYVQIVEKLEERKLLVVGKETGALDTSKQKASRQVGLTRSLNVVPVEN